MERKSWTGEQQSNQNQEVVVQIRYEQRGKEAVNNDSQLSILVIWEDINV